MFERGRILGKLETEARWQLKDAGRRTRQAVKDAAARLHRERDEDWSGLDDKALLEKLVEKKVITIKEGNIIDASLAEAFGELCKNYLQQKEAGNPKSEGNEENKQSVEEYGSKSADEVDVPEYSESTDL